MKFFTKGERVRVNDWRSKKPWEGVVRGSLQSANVVLIDRPGGLAGVAHVHPDNIERIEA